MKEDGMIPCPHCGEMIKRSARACPHCGSDEQTGWSDQTYLDGIDLADDFDYDSALENEFSGGKKRHSRWKSWTTITGIIVLLLFLIMILRYV